MLARLPEIQIKVTLAEVSKVVQTLVDRKLQFSLLTLLTEPDTASIIIRLPSDSHVHLDELLENLTKET